MQAANRQKRLVEDLLLLNQIEASRFQLQTVATQVTALVQQAAAEVQTVYPGQSIDARGPADLCLYADIARVGQILVNMLDKHFQGYLTQIGKRLVPYR